MIKNTRNSHMRNSFVFHICVATKSFWTSRFLLVTWFDFIFNELSHFDTFISLFLPFLFLYPGRFELCAPFYYLRKLFSFISTRVCQHLKDIRVKISFWNKDTWRKQEVGKDDFLLFSLISIFLLFYVITYSELCIIRFHESWCILLRKSWRY